MCEYNILDADFSPRKLSFSPSAVQTEYVVEGGTGKGTLSEDFDFTLSESFHSYLSHLPPEL